MLRFGVYFFIYDYFYRDTCRLRGVHASSYAPYTLIPPPRALARPLLFIRGLFVCALAQIAWRSGVIAARKRRFTLACCKGTAVQAVACVQIGPKNESVRSFLAQDACMSLCLLIVDPEAPMFKAGAHLCKEVSSWK